MSSTPSKTERGSCRKASQCLTIVKSSLAECGALTHIDTSCWASTSSGLRRVWTASICPSAILRATTADSSMSPRAVGNSTPCEMAPTWWPARPTRCRPLDTEGGDCTWITRSTAPMSMPSSNELVATTHGSRPLFRSSSICARRCLLTEPWWALATMGTSVPSRPFVAADGSITWAGSGCGSSLTPRSWACNSLRWAVRRSATRREFTKQMVERWDVMRSRIRRSIGGHIEGWRPVPSCSAASRPASGSVMSSTGTTTLRSQVLAAGGLITAMSRSPARKPATRSGGRTVADSPIRWNPPRWLSAATRSRLTIRCAPRFVPASAWTSSTMTVSTLRRVSAALLDNMRNSDSGVVMRMSGGWVAMRRRCAAVVSPERTATLTRGSGSPSRSAVAVMPRRGACRFRSMSTARAFRGEMYNTRTPLTCAAGSCVGAAPSEAPIRAGCVARDASRSRLCRKAARVLPEPVGAMTNALLPEPMACQAAICTGVGAANTSVNHVRAMGPKPAIAASFAGAVASDVMGAILTRGTDIFEWATPRTRRGGPAG
ncbi:hypothetical protein MAJHIDBO_01827 [Propionibacterium freudenreichii subsp. shermanii]|nr:hypothetical protein MAJHIDBO_01827 [Propionibacterium freudenreichii subsp. shermanii]SPS09616.1 hypothetical protein MAJHIDBO_01827 [Propionibacterium freudenreichii subsp. shermanii]